MSDQKPGPDDTPTPSYTATPLAGPTVPYTVPAPVATAPERPRRRLGLLVSGVAAASLLVLAAAFGGGVLVGAHVAGPRPGFAVDQGGLPGGPGFDRELPGPPDGTGPGQRDSDDGDSDEGSTGDRS